MAKRFTHDGTEYVLVEQHATFGEARAIEKLTGVTFKALATDPEAQQSLDVIQAMFWISMKRVDPTLKFEDLDAIAIDDLLESVVDDDPQTKEDAAQAALPTGGDVDSNVETTSPLSA